MTDRGVAQPVVILIHGMGRTPLSMRRLARRLRQTGCETRSFGYLATLQSFDSIVARLLAYMAELQHRPSLLVGHSLGGLIARTACGRLPAAQRPRHLVMLGTPQRAPRLARWLGHNWWFRLLFGDPGQLLASRQRMRRLPAAAVPVSLIAGTAGPKARWYPFRGRTNDWIVGLNETYLAGAPQPLLLQRSHSFIMNAPEVAAVIAGLLAAPASEQQGDETDRHQG